MSATPSVLPKSEVLGRIRSGKIVALIPAARATSLASARALAAAGINCWELALATPGGFDICAQLAAELPDAVIGLGTVVDADAARQGIAAGAKFIATPAFRPDVIAVCREAGIAIVSGAQTLADACAAHAAGADAIKISPGELLGPAHVAALRASHPEIAWIPIGGVTPENVAEYFRAGAFAVVAGAGLVDPAALASGDWPALTARARQFVGATSESRPGP